MGKHKPTKKASYTASKLVIYLKRGGYILFSRLSPYFLFSFSTVQCTPNFDLPSKEQAKPNAVFESLKLSAGEKDDSRIPITVQLKSPQGGEPETVTVFYDPDTDTFFGADGKALCEELLALIQGTPLLAYKQSTNKQGDRVVIVEVYSDTNELLGSTKTAFWTSQLIMALNSPMVTLRRGPLRGQQEVKESTTTFMASSPKKPAPSENEKMEDDNSVEAQQAEMSLDDEGYLQVPGLEGLNIRLCTTPSQSVSKEVALIDSNVVRGHPTYSPVGPQKRVTRQANICVRIFLKEGYKSAYSGQYTIVYQGSSFTLEPNSSALLILGPTNNKRIIERDLGTLQVKLGGKIIKIPLPVLRFSN